ncbi:MAG: hypothetical protein QOJ53_1402 [Sphingomonadales bacterium]|jgi:hypothetical protein|nr:hypothetical protein [Sphingomonadales bacterium]MEA3047070.1 hypothetical protein [Sphingomonadales bacterium]
MAIVRLLMLVIGALAVLMGLLWIGQGTGYVRWPETSFMINESAWALRGAVLAVGGALMILFGRRIGR